jgi:hypothetical protein
MRRAIGDLFLGRYQRGPAAAALLAEVLAAIAARLAQRPVPETRRVARPGAWEGPPALF